MVEALGILATIFVLISFLFKSTLKIRLVNIIGAVLFVIYGLLINSISVWLLNGALIIIHLYFIIKKEYQK
jgi:hypothetical protein